jgi:hypothetical protein
VLPSQKLAEAIKAEWPKLPVILATGFAETPANACAYPRLAKPFTQTELKESLARIEANGGLPGLGAVGLTSAAGAFTRPGKDHLGARGAPPRLASAPRWQRRRTARRAS